MITLKDLEGVKLVKEEYYASISDTQDALERVFVQGSQGWGVRRDDGVLLRMARDMNIALALANSADENGRMLKGAQMELGRVKKQKSGLDAIVAGNMVDIEGLLSELSSSQRLVDTLEKRVDYLESGKQDQIDESDEMRA